MKFFLIFCSALVTACSASKMTSTNNYEDAIRSGSDVFLQDAVIEKPLDFTKLLAHNLISEGVMQSKTNASITFLRCRFKDKVAGFSTDKNGVFTLTAFGRNVSFLQCTFEDEVSFRGATIDGRADFSGSTFAKSANFEETTFHDNAFFGKTTFEQEARFQNCFFNKKANFTESNFAKAVNFQSAFFNWEVQFNLSKMREYADFSLVTFSHDAFFNYAECSKRLVFENITSRGRFEMMNATLNEANLTNAHFSGFCRFNDAKVGKELNFSNSFFAQKPETDAVPAERINKTNTQFSH